VKRFIPTVPQKSAEGVLLQRSEEGPNGTPQGE
jgi:hypothetical protein